MGVRCQAYNLFKLLLTRVAVLGTILRLIAIKQ